MSVHKTGLDIRYGVRYPGLMHGSGFNFAAENYALSPYRYQDFMYNIQRSPAVRLTEQKSAKTPWQMNERLSSDVQDKHGLLRNRDSADCLITRNCLWLMLTAPSPPSPGRRWQGLLLLVHFFPDWKARVVWRAISCLFGWSWTWMVCEKRKFG